MISSGTILKVIDNSGAVQARCIRILGNKKEAKLGDHIVVSIQKSKPNSRILEGRVQKGLILQVKKPTRFIDGSLLSQGLNSIILLNNQGNPIGNRLHSPIIFSLNDNSEIPNWLSPISQKEKELFYKLNIISQTLI
jgi:large subunit ribosomal protein L14